MRPLCILAILKGKQRDWRQPVPTDEEEADMLKLWIVGASGQIGSAINEVLDPLEMEVFNTDKEELDITDTDEVLNFGVINRPDVIINCAAVTDTDLCEKEPELAYRVNALGARNLSIVARMAQRSSSFQQMMYLTESGIPHIQSSMTQIRRPFTDVPREQGRIM